jgi:hypothetical protein
MKAVGVATTNPIELLGVADLAVQRLDELSIEKLMSLVQPVTHETQRNAG